MFAKVLLLAVLISACGNSEGQTSSAEARRAAPIPTVRMEGKEYPYIQYSEATGKTESRGRVFFLYPITDLKNRLSAAEYTPGTKLENLFAEDIIGISGMVVRVSNQIRVEFLPISFPTGIAAGQEWRLQYTKREFVCRSRALSDTQEVGQIGVSCISGNYTLNFKFHRERGVTEYQDFCNFSICTYKLVGSQGLLSKSMTDFMGLPPI